MNPQEIYNWRKQLRRRLIEARLALPGETLRAHREHIDSHLERSFGKTVRGVVAFCWPYKNEYDVRGIAAAWRKRGVVTALPVIAQPGSPLGFREWHPGIKLESGPLGIPYPVGSAEVIPDSVLLPMVGFDAKAYRLGYGGGYFDRTLASFVKRPLVIGLAYEILFLQTIHPLPHDMQVDYVVTERGRYRRSGGELRFEDGSGGGFSSPPCYASEIAPDYFGDSPARKS